MDAQHRAAFPSAWPGAEGCRLCASCPICLPENLGFDKFTRLERLIARRRRIPRHEVLFRTGDPGTLYAVRFGHFKCVRTDRRGGQHIIAFQMAGEVLGIDAVGSNVHASTAIALEDGEVCEIPLARLRGLLEQIPSLLAPFHQLLGREILREQAAMILLGNMRAEQRLAGFLLDLSERYAMRGYSPRSFQLRMSREDIGGYLGLTIECVSRQLARFRRHGWIALDKRAVELTDLDALVALATGMKPAPAASDSRQACIA